MRVTETIPAVLTWAEIKAHCSLHDEEWKEYLTAAALGCVEAFERETGIAVGVRSQTILYSADDLKTSNKLPLPKGPVVSVTSVNGSTDLSGYEIRKVGHAWYLHSSSSFAAPVTVVVSVGHGSVPQLIKQGLLLHVEHMRLNRGATSSQSQALNEMGLDRIYGLYRTYKTAVG